MERLHNRKIKLEFMFENKNQTYSKLTLTSDEIYFNVSVNKYIAHLKDEAIINLFNLDEKTYWQLKQAASVSIYTSRVINGVEHNFLIATQSVLMVTIDKSDLVNQKTVVVCSSRFRKQEKKPFLIKSGTPLFNALNLITQRASIRAKISPKLKHKVLKNDLTVAHVSTAISQVLRDYPFIQVNNDSNGENFDIEFQVISLNENVAVYQISPHNFTLINGWVNIDSDSNINFTSLPDVLPYKIGNCLSVNNTLLNQYVDNSSNYTNYRKVQNRIERSSEKQELKDGSIDIGYIIIALEYVLDVRGNWQVNIKARLRNAYDTTRINKGGL